MISYNFICIIYRKLTLTSHYNKGKINITNTNDMNFT